MKRARLWLRLARLAAVLLLGLALACGVTLVERLWRGDLMGLRQRLTAWFLRRLSGTLPFEVEVQGELPRGPHLWVGNHVSWTDIPLLGQLLPISFLSKAEVRTWPLAGWLAHKAGTLFIRRGSGDSALLARQLHRHLGAGLQLLIFPEGTTTDGLQVRTFHGRLLTGAIEAGVPLQPVAIRYLRDGEPDLVAPFIGDDDLPSHLLRLFASDRARVQIQLLAPIPSAGQERNALARQAQRAVQAALFGEQEERGRVAA
ncbi:MULTISPECIES: lysophospholipid acyltransferase family protein [unclassified Pseudomonas]|uniref:lysophospholipid acyltransferase family protein n=1 Tax=unclassified Pseudomonas TaxID=196821 RepID=UPI002447B81A|nr:MULTISPECIES: lysophospholipid acyltransferase family protein [unclassified Pseudomonas]MDG9928682.1 1-acyl-sn-glycerol-3-phosphate acyltransferase [Pseudomonas sp. GD04042]MDH0481751.1 1-acyl-sn-glycerol-3-phosphate acyltransferase [Pseudomonas sp. GD04015]MDH0603123.1 1-acyl-sn-glycerol-3-phosphate acyltransferase [Pseudomonas sp. GD03869]